MKTNIIDNTIRIHQGLLPVNGTWHGGKEGGLLDGFENRKEGMTRSA